MDMVKVKVGSCVYCSNRKVLIGFNDIKTINNTMYNLLKNKLDGEKYVEGNTRVFLEWVCSRGHEYISRPVEILKSIKTGREGCPTCDGKKPDNEFNSLEYKYPELSKQMVKMSWMSPKTVTPKSDKIGWFRCREYNNHVFDTQIKSFVISKGGCPYCSSNRLLRNFNDLHFVNGKLSSEWDYELNLLNPWEVFSNQREPVWWKCLFHGSWEASPDNRNRRGDGCPSCSMKKTSRVESKFRESFREFTNKVNEDHTTRVPVSDWTYRTASVDILVDNKLVVEYDGSWWHRDKIIIDTDKTKSLINSGYCVVRIRENDLEYLPIKNKNLLQVNYKYSSEDEEKIITLTSKIYDWWKTRDEDF